MDKNKVQVTKVGLAEVQKEYDHLVHVVRAEVIAEIEERLLSKGTYVWEENFGYTAPFASHALLPLHV